MKIAIHLLALGLLLFSCKKDDKEELPQPQFESVTFNGTAPVEGQELEINIDQQLKIDVALSSQIELSQLSVEIHEAFNAHDHARLALNNDDTLSYGPQLFTLSDKAATVTVYDDFLVPSLTPGEYHLELIVLDKDGNRNESITEFHLH